MQRVSLVQPTASVGQQDAATYLEHGQTPFFRLPSVVTPETRAVLLGVPYDGGTTVQPGARLAPYHVRRVSAFTQSYHPQHEIDVFGRLGAIDGGNVLFPPLDRAFARASIQARVEQVFNDGARPFTIGGDHSIVLPILRGLAGKLGPLAVVHVDAHFDTSDGEIWGDEFHHGTPLRHALMEGLIEPGQLHQIGIRASCADAEELAFSRSAGARLHTIDDIEQRGVHEIAREVAAEIGDRPAYVTFDVDAIDPAFAPGTGTPVPGGLTSREGIALLRALSGIDIFGMDVVEVCPALDCADQTAHLAAQLLYEGLALLAVREASRIDKARPAIA